MLINNLILIALASIITIDGIGIYNNQAGLIGAVFLVCFGIILIRDIKISQTLKLLFFLFFILTLISDCLSTNLANSVKFTLIYTASFFAFAYANINKDYLSKFVVPLIFILSIFLSLYSTVLPILIKQDGFLLPSSGYQLIYPTFGSHNHLGDFLLLSLVACFYFLFTKSFSKHSQNYKQVIICLLIFFFLPYFIFSYSRSSYVSLSLTLIIMSIFLIKKNLNKKSLTVFGLIAITLVLSSIFLLSVSDIKDESIFKNVKTNLHTTHNLSNKYPSGNRLAYFSQGLLSITDKPLFGVGPGNFVYVSKKYKNPTDWWTETSHNIFLDVFVENGLFAGLIFLFIILNLLINSKKNVFFFMALALLLDFQSDYTYRIHSIFLLFSILMGLAYEARHLTKAKSDNIENI
ncbi:MAG TPA: O-antigen ligase family protein [Patescibacteria group bacterium]|nr:O-antigen ligase family protein [Patescibacteria group bacterium]